MMCKLDLIIRLCVSDMVHPLTSKKFMVRQAHHPEQSRGIKEL